MSLPAKLQNLLKQRKLTFGVVPHKTVFTAYDVSQTLKVKLSEVAKTLLLKVHAPKKLSREGEQPKDAHYVLAVLPAHLRLDLEKVKKFLGAKKVAITSESEMTEALKVKPGALTPFGTLHRLNVIMDKTLLKVSQALFGAGSFTESLRLKVKDYQRTEQPLTGDIASKKH